MENQDSPNTLASVMRYEINEVTRSVPNTIYFDIEAVVHTPEKDIKILYPNNLGKLKDYVNRYSELVNLSVSLPMGTFLHDIFPHKEELEITVKLKPLLTSKTYKKYHSGEIRSTRYIAKLTESSSKLAEGNTDVHTSKKHGDNHHISEVNFQLVTKTATELKDLTVGFIARQCIPMDVVILSLTKFSKYIDKEDGEPRIKGVTVASGYSTKIREHVVIPQLTRLVDLPNVVNRGVGGLYPTGFSYYLEEGYWYIYPMYDTQRYAKQEQFSITIINVPKNRMPDTEKTFRVTANQLIILATGQVKHKDIFDYDKGTTGTATRFVDANRVADNFGAVKNNRFIPSRTLNTEQITLKDSQDSNPTSQYSSRDGRTKLTASKNEEMSYLAEKSLAKIMIEWQNSNDKLLIPAMPVRYMFLVNGEVRQVYGTLLAAETSTTQDNNDPVKKKFKSTTVLSCLVQRNLNPTQLQ